MKRGHIEYGPCRVRVETLREREHGGLPTGSPEAAAAIERVRLQNLEKKRVPLSIKRAAFADKTGFADQ